MILNPFNTGALLNVTLDGNAKLAQGSREGYYTLNSTLVNGKLNWIKVQGQAAIWYDKEYSNWKIGSKANLGKSICSLKSTNDAKRPEEATTWEYFAKDGKWLPTSNIFGSSMY